MNEEWRKLSVTACVHRSYFYYDRKEVYSEWFAISSQVKMCLGEDYLPFAKRAFNFQIKHSSFITDRVGARGGGVEKWGDSKTSDRRKSCSSCWRLECWGQCAESHLRKVNLGHFSNIWKCLGKYTWREKKVLWMSNIVPQILIWIKIRLGPRSVAFNTRGRKPSPWSCPGPLREPVWLLGF